MPSFALKGVDFNKVWINDLNDPKSDKPISGGPFYLPNGGWNRGKDLTLLRNPKYWGPKAKLTKVVYRFLPDTNSTAEAIRGREVDVIYPHNAKKAIALMKSHGCRGGPNTPGAGGIWSCNGTRASFKFKWKSGNQLRQLSFEAFQAQLKDVGIQLVSDDTPNALSEDLPAGNYDIILFAWLGSPDISGTDAIYGCRTGSTHAQDNNQGYCRRNVDKLLVAANHQRSAWQHV